MAGGARAPAEPGSWLIGSRAGAGATVATSAGVEMGGAASAGIA